MEPPIYLRFPEPEKIVGLRNIVIHSYAQVNPKVLWSLAAGGLAAIKELLNRLLDEAARQGH